MPDKKYLTTIKSNNINYSLKDLEARESINSLEDSSVNISFADEEIIFGTGKTYDYKQNNNIVRITNAPFVQQNKTVKI